MKTFKIGAVSIDVLDYASRGNAVLGIRDSGKTITAKGCAEHLMDAGVPLTVFDPTGVWRFLRVAGKGKGYPVVVVGGPEGDFPLTQYERVLRAAIQHGVSVVIDLFGRNVPKAEWKRVVVGGINMLMDENAKYGLRHVVIEEAAEFAPQRVSGKAAVVYEAVESLVRTGGNYRLGVTLVNQRSQELNKAVLELCDNLFLHRQKGHHAIDYLGKWFHSADVDTAEEIKRSLANLPTGECWVWMRESDPARVKVPLNATFHPDRRQIGASDAKIEAASVDVSKFVTMLKSAIEAETEKRKPVGRPATKPSKTVEIHHHGAVTVDTAEIKRLTDQAYARGAAAVAEPALSVIEKLRLEISNIRVQARVALEHADHFWKETGTVIKALERHVAKGSQAPEGPKKVSLPTNGARPASDSGLPRPEQRILDSLASWSAIGHDQPTNAQVAWLARYSPKSTGYTNPRSALRSKGLIDYPSQDRVALTAAGGGMAVPMQFGSSILETVLTCLSGPEQRILQAAADHFPHEASNEEIAAAANYSHSSTGYTNPRSALRTKELITYPSRDKVRAADWLFSKT